MKTKKNKIVILALVLFVSCAVFSSCRTGSGCPTWNSIKAER